MRRRTRQPPSSFASPPGIQACVEILRAPIQPKRCACRSRRATPPHHMERSNRDVLPMRALRRHDIDVTILSQEASLPNSPSVQPPRHQYGIYTRPPTGMRLTIDKHARATSMCERSFHHQVAPRFGFRGSNPSTGSLWESTLLPSPVFNLTLSHDHQFNNKFCAWMQSKTGAERPRSRPRPRAFHLAPS